ncbi:hypothetical protein [Nonomuraea dietziae]|uniref:hypothetical protein n=1 Tax=Nonomuraea dietziae TaxID=65515 RepID=UPI003421C356
MMQGSDVALYGWDDPWITVGEGMSAGAGLRRRPRAALEGYALAVVEGRDGDMLAMTLPYE